jgi:hypothetical protein
MFPRAGSQDAMVNTELNGQKQSPREGEGRASTLSDLLAASEQAADALRRRADVPVEALTGTATEDEVMRAREQLPQLEASLSQLTALMKKLHADADRLRTALAPDGVDRPSSQTNIPAQFDRRALLISLNMASNGASREEAADYLAENLDLHDCDELLGEIYSYVASTRTSPR